ncbi:fluoride efflux transporter CrcB [uncultured Parolsenella sp.]|uniref:fluoride efflux transporter CrcB n=1 Tax=uncultured Parolsenella sp. TaxID=2083008 RepID=UPI0025F1AF11|nr:fluoride efflux transporter CrcB [uncultured Parolsenella sp.]
MLDVLAVFAGGGLGAVARHLLTLVPWKAVGAVEFPLGTLVTNVLGSFAIGLIVGAATRGLPPRAVLFAKTGVCGGFTTFSTFALESQGLIDRGSYGTAAAYMLLSFALGVAACVAGQLLAERLLASAR